MTRLAVLTLLLLAFIVRVPAATDSHGGTGRDTPEQIMKHSLALFTLLASSLTPLSASAGVSDLIGAWNPPPTGGWTFAVVYRTGGKCDVEALHTFNNAGVDYRVLSDWKCTYAATGDTIRRIFRAYGEVGKSVKKPSFDYVRALEPDAAGPQPQATIRYTLARTPRGDAQLVVLKANGDVAAILTKGSELAISL